MACGLQCADPLFQENHQGSTKPAVLRKTLTVNLLSNGEAILSHLKEKSESRLKVCFPKSDSMGLTTMAASAHARNRFRLCPFSSVPQIHIPKMCEIGVIFPNQNLCQLIIVCLRGCFTDYKNPESVKK